ncbi:MAG: serine hydrolase [Vicinamibacteria bacterium]
MTRAGSLVLLGCLLAGSALPAPASTQQGAPAPGAASPAPPGPEAVLEILARRIQAAVQSLDGVAGVYVKDLTSGREVALRSDQVFPQASTIKLALLYELYRQAEEGRVDLAESRPVAGPRAGGSGVLQFLSPDVVLSWRDLAVLTMAESDNAATNLLIERVGLPAVNARLDSLGLHATRLRRRMMDADAAKRGDENVSTPREMARLLETMRAGTGLSPARARDLIDVASVPKEAPFRRPLPESLRLADKPGSLEGVRCAAALVDLPGRPYVASVMTTYLARDEEGEAFIAAISELLYDSFSRLATASPYGRRME